MAEPGACGDPKCHVLHADPANPIHPPWWGKEDTEDDAGGPKRIDLNEFRDFGYLQEVNRRFFHPLGLALEVQVDDDGNVVGLGGIWDYRDDPEGICYGSDQLDFDKAWRVSDAETAIAKTRLHLLGFVVQPLLEN